MTALAENRPRCAAVAVLPCGNLPLGMVSACRRIGACLALTLVLASGLAGAQFDIRQYGATPNDPSDDTQAIRKALEACAAAGGGTIFVPAGTYVVSRQKSESPILELPSNTILCGEGPASVLKFDPRVNQSNFWRMLGAAGKDCRNVTVRDLHLDGSNTHPKYVKGETPEHNHGIFLYQEGGVIENVTLQDLLVEHPRQRHSRGGDSRFAQRRPGCSDTRQSCRIRRGATVRSAYETL